jgi:hypothetical protein
VEFSFLVTADARRLDIIGIRYYGTRAGEGANVGKCAPSNIGGGGDTYWGCGNGLA